MPSYSFYPWRGEDYDSAPLGKRILILGESLYDWEAGNPVQQWPSITQDSIQEQVDGNGPTYKFWTNIAAAFLGHLPNQQEKAFFWNAVAFYNYVQQSVGFGPRCRPTEEIWRATKNEALFFHLIKSIQPEVIIVLEYELWSYMPKQNRRQGPIIGTEGRPETVIYKNQNGESLAYCIKHPSTGFSSNFWRPYISQAIDLA